METAFWHVDWEVKLQIEEIFYQLFVLVTTVLNKMCKKFKKVNIADNQIFEHFTL